MGNWVDSEPLKYSQMTKVSSWQVAVAAEAAVAMVFARAGWNVSVQYGANQPEYDLMVENGSAMLKVSVKGSQDGSWGLTQGLLSNADYHGAADAWLAKHTMGTIYAFAQFKGAALADAPRIYLARPSEVVQQLKKTAKGRGDTILYERQEWTKRAAGAGSIDEIPPSWRFSEQRLRELS
jgi:hypothetical protein